MSTFVLVDPKLQSTNETFPTIPPAFSNDQQTQLGVNTDVCVDVGVGVTDVGIPQLVTVLTVPLSSNVTAYLDTPSIINEYPLGLDVYVRVVKFVSLYIIKPFVIAKVSSIYFVKPVVPEHVDDTSI
jgi:hypothetical protein